MSFKSKSAPTNQFAPLFCFGYQSSFPQTVTATQGNKIGGELFSSFQLQHRVSWWWHLELILSEYKLKHLEVAFSSIDISKSYNQRDRKYPLIILRFLSFQLQRRVSWWWHLELILPESESKQFKVALSSIDTSKSQKQRDRKYTLITLCFLRFHLLSWWWYLDS